LRARTAHRGAGPIGAVAATLLPRRGYDVCVYERRADPRAGTRETTRSSLNLALGERGLGPLADAGIDDVVRRVSVPMYGRSIHVDGSTTFQPYGNRGEALQCATRHDVHCALLDVAEREPRVQLRFGQRCVDIDLDEPSVSVEEPSGRVRVRGAGHVVAADGLRSVVRAAFARRRWFSCV